jgi:hypothetical protein
MPNFFRTIDGKVWKASQAIRLELADGEIIQGIWAGSAQEEKLDWWLRPAVGNKLAQSDEVAAVAAKAEDDGELIWGEAPAGARIFFILIAPDAGKDYWLAKMVTTAANPAQVAHFRHARFALFGKFRPGGGIEKIPPVEPPPPPPPAQPELF